MLPDTVTDETCPFGEVLTGSHLILDAHGNYLLADNYIMDTKGKESRETALKLTLATKVDPADYQAAMAVVNKAAQDVTSEEHKLVLNELVSALVTYSEKREALKTDEKAAKAFVEKTQPWVTNFNNAWKKVSRNAPGCFAKPFGLWLGHPSVKLACLPTRK